MIRIGIFGGTFDPPHIGHLIMAQRAYEQLSLDTVFFVPNNIPPHKRKPSASAKDRLNMLRLAVLPHSHFEVSECEIERGGVSFSVDTVFFFKEEFPGTEIFLLVGEDSARNFRKWKDYKSILEVVKVAWFPRLTSVGGEIPSDFLKIEAEIIDISSTRIRQLIKDGRSVKYLVPDSVLNYIRIMNLYSRDGGRKGKI